MSDEDSSPDEGDTPDDPESVCDADLSGGGSCTFKAKYPDGRCGHHTEHDTGAERREGRPSKLSYDVQESIAADLEAGKSMNSAARKVELNPTTVYNWLSIGQNDIEAGKENEYTEFFKRITRAKGYGEDFYFKTIIEMAKEDGDHRFIASMMKQRYPDSWGDTETGVEADTIEVTSEVVEWTENEVRNR